MTRNLGNLRCARITCHDISLEHDNPALFIKPQYGPIWIALVWYCLWCGYFFSTMFVDILVYHRDGSRQLWLVSLSNWNYLLAIATTLGEVAVRTLVLCRHREILDGSITRLTWYLKVQWVLENTFNTMAVLVLLLHFVFINNDVTFSSANKHIVTTVYVITNAVLVTSSPNKLLHLYQPMAFAAFYLVFITILQFSYRNDTYTKLYDWDNPTKSAILSVCSILVIVPIIHFLFYCIYKLRIFLREKCFLCENSPRSSPKPQVQRDITATDVILEEDSRNYHYVDIDPDIKDDTNLKLDAERQRASIHLCNPRLHKSETDLQKYRMTNGFYCDFAKSSPISHHSSPPADDDPAGRIRSPKYDQNENLKGSQIIMVKKCNTPTSSIKGDNSDDTASDASSDYLSQYIEEDLIAYYL